MASFSLAAFGEETSGRERRQSSGPNAEGDETDGGPFAPFREHVRKRDPFPFDNQISKKSGVRMTKWRNGNRRPATSAVRVM